MKGKILLILGLVLSIPSIIWAAFSGFGGYMDMGVQGIKAAFIGILAVSGVGGLLMMGDIDSTDIIGTQPTNHIAIANGTIPDSTSDGIVFIGSQDVSGDTKASLSFYVESDLSADTTGASTYVLPITINGGKYNLMLTGNGN